jgi:hypothetical protein
MERLFFEKLIIYEMLDNEEIEENIEEPLTKRKTKETKKTTNESSLKK